MLTLTVSSSCAPFGESCEAETICVVSDVLLPGGP